MMRHYIRQGDQTTAGGVVTEGLANFNMYGGPSAYHGAAVACPSCKSVGKISCIGPRRPFTLPNGQQIALENDLCICKCKVPPRLLASQSAAYMSFEPDELQRMGFTPSGGPQPVAVSGPLAGTTGADAGWAAAPVVQADLGEYSERLAVFNAATGEGVSTPYALYRDQTKVDAGTTGADGYSPRHQDERAASITALIGENAPWAVAYRPDDEPQKERGD